MASTGALLNPYSGQWDEELIARLGLPRQILQPLVLPGTPVGPLSSAICQELAIQPIPVMAVGEHDTASAVAAVPAAQPDFIYISSGTWSLMGIESPAPVINDQALYYQFTNEGGLAAPSVS
jgi:rhamnulokinase